MFNHETVLLKETVDGLNIKKNGVYVDCTLGGGGHSGRILYSLKSDGWLYCFDQDQEAINHTSKKLEENYSNFTIIKSNFRNIKKELNKLGVEKVDGILMDLGISSHQVDKDYRGFSYHQDAKLDMRMDTNSSLTAYDIVNNMDALDIANILYKYGDEKFSRKIAANIVKERENKNIETTFELVEIIKKSIPAKFKRDKHPARKTFQALRIAVNDEINALEEGLQEGYELLNEGGRLSIITFHSLEDRIVKEFINKYSKAPEQLKKLPVMINDFNPTLKKITRKPIIPSELEIESNNRARSAKLRIAEKI